MNYRGGQLDNKAGRHGKIDWSDRICIVNSIRVQLKPMNTCYLNVNVKWRKNIPFDRLIFLWRMFHSMPWNFESSWRSFTAGTDLSGYHRSRLLSLPAYLNTLIHINLVWKLLLFAFVFQTGTSSDIYSLFCEKKMKDNWLICLVEYSIVW